MNMTFRNNVTAFSIISPSEFLVLRIGRMGIGCLNEQTLIRTSKLNSNAVICSSVKYFDDCFCVPLFQ